MAANTLSRHSGRRPSLHPTLWRTCRVLANRKRLRLLKAVHVDPYQTVTAIALQVRMPVTLVSQYLRDLNARGLLSATRRGRSVRYRVAADESVPSARPLLRAVLLTFETDWRAAHFIYRQATAFTHPRRVALMAAMPGAWIHESELRRTTGIPRTALRRHLGKLEARGMVVGSQGWWCRVRPRDQLSRTLIRLALCD